MDNDPQTNIEPMSPSTDSNPIDADQDESTHPVVATQTNEASSETALNANNTQESPEIQPAADTDLVNPSEEAPDTMVSNETAIEPLQKEDANQTKKMTAIEAQLRGLQGSIEILSHQMQLLQQQIKDQTQQHTNSEKKKEKNNKLHAESDKKHQGESTLYQQAFEQMKQQHNQNAIHLFVKLIKQYPEGTYTPNTYYWLGEIFFEKQKLNLALSLFEKVMHDFPQHAFSANASYKRALILAQLNKHDASIEALNKVIKDYPETTAARLATLKLNE